MDGYIYIMTNPGFKENLVKIGYSKNPEQRRKELSRSSGTPAEYEIYATYAVQQKLSDKSLHKLIDTINPDLRLSKNKEFYEVSPEQAYNWLEAISQISHTENRLKRSKKILSKAKNVKSKLKPPFRFHYCGIKPGEEITFVRDNNIKATVVDDKKVEYQGEIYSLSALAKSLLTNRKGDLRGPLYFTYKGKTLSDIRNELGN